MGRVRVPSSWSGAEGTSGRVTLAGDAAHGQHPMAGWGGNSALLGACTLVEMIRSTPKKDGGSKDAIIHDWFTIFERYENIHRPRAEFIQMWANYVGCGMKLSDEHKTLVDRWLSRLFLPEESFPEEVHKILQEFNVLNQKDISTLN